MPFLTQSTAQSTAGRQMAQSHDLGATASPDDQQVQPFCCILQHVLGHTAAKEERGGKRDTGSSLGSTCCAQKATPAEQS